MIEVISGIPKTLLDDPTPLLGVSTIVVDPTILVFIKILIMIITLTTIRVTTRRWHYPSRRDAPERGRARYSEPATLRPSPSPATPSGRASPRRPAPQIPIFTEPRRTRPRRRSALATATPSHRHHLGCPRPPAPSLSSARDATVAAPSASKSQPATSTPVSTQSRLFSLVLCNACSALSHPSMPRRRAAHNGPTLALARAG